MSIDEHGSRTAPLPRLRTDLVVGEPDDDGKVMITDPASGRSYLVSRGTHHVLTCFDGSRTQEDVHAHLTAAGSAVSADALAKMCVRATDMGLFEGATGPVAPLPAHLRGPSRRSLLFFQVAEVDPTRVVTALRPVGRVLFSRPAALVLVALLVVAGSTIAHESERYVQDLQVFTDFRAWVLVYLGNAAVTVLHELGHALAVARFGGRTRRMGLAVYLLSPAAYTDTSAAYAFPETRHRVVVSLGGVYVESIVLGVGVLVWAADLLPATASGGLFILCHALLARILFNLNPLLRLDGYWLLTDVLGITNLRAKAFTVLLATLSPVRADRRRASFVSSGEERAVLLLFAVLSGLALLVGVAGGYVLLDQLLRRVVGPYPVAVTWAGAGVVAVVAVVSAVRYVMSLRQASFVRGGTHG